MAEHEQDRSLEEMLGHSFADPGLLQQALTHASRVSGRVRSNERLEFLGDSILGLVICRYLYGRFPESLEGELTAMKSFAVSREVTGRAAREMGLASHLLVGKGIAAQDILPDSILANAFEALVAALYLDGGPEAAEAFVLKHLVPVLERFSEEAVGNYKSALQERLQQDGAPVPEYRVVEESGPDHEKRFRVGVYVEGSEIAFGSGTSKKEAEQAAAGAALASMKEKDASPPGMNGRG
jgi:ribonuclease III